MRYASISSHRSMVYDQRRNEYYYNALKQVVTPDSIVLDLGAGLGIHGLLAAKLGAKQVYMVEPEDIITVAKQIAEDNGLEKKIRFYRGKIEDIDLPSQVDIIISVLTGNFLLNEDLLPSLFYARETYLKPDGDLIPDKAVMFATPVYLPELYDKEIEVWSQTLWELDFIHAKQYSSNTLFYRRDELSKASYLAKPDSLFEMDFYSIQDVYCDFERIYTITKSSLCHGWIGWFDLQLGDQWLSTAPHEPKLHWSPAFLPLDPPINFVEGEQVRFRIIRPPLGNWSWIVETENTKQKHSTILAEPLSKETVRKIALSYTPQLNEDGEVVMYILSQADGGQTTQQIVDKLLSKYNNRYSYAAAQKLVQSLVKHYG